MVSTPKKTGCHREWATRSQFFAIFGSPSFPGWARGFALQVTPGLLLSDGR
jgi:hypothetical protein